MRILGIVGSPRKNGNTDAIVSEVLRGAASQDAACEKVSLGDLRISGCIACDACKVGPGYIGCAIDDDMQPIYQQLLAADALVIGSPIYCFGPTAQVKAFLDRWYAFSYQADGQRKFRLTGKPIVLALVYGDSNPFTSGVTNAHAIFRDEAAWCGLNLQAVLHGTANIPGEIRENTSLMARAYEAGMRLVTGF